MKISIITPTYNRANLLSKLYNSIKTNKKEQLQIEWLIMDDGSKDNTEEVVKSFEQFPNVEIKYYFQENQGKMNAINNVIEHVTGDLIIECDSDDYFSENAFEKIEKAYVDCKNEKNIYAMCFLKYDSNGNNMGNNFKKDKTTMFDLYFKEGENGEKALVFFAEIRKKYKYKLEKNEKFGTEARLYHEMDSNYQIKCYNEKILICEYQNEGYTKNIQKIFKENPYGYFEYFKEILQNKDFKGVSLKKRLYVIKHYILFSTLTQKKNILRQVKSLKNKILIILLYIPGKLATKIKFKE